MHYHVYYVYDVTTFCVDAGHELGKFEIYWS